MLGLLVWLVALAASPAVQAQTPAQPERCDTAQLVTQAQRSIERNGQVQDSRTVSALDTIPRIWQREDTPIRYRIALGDCAAHAGRALWIYRIGAPYRVTVDGQPLQAIQPFAPLQDVVYNGRVPALFALPVGGQTLEIQLVTLPYVRSGLIRVAVGPQARLMPEHARHYLGLVALNDVSSAIVLAVGLITLAVWALRRQDRQIAWFGVACMAWAMRGLLYQTFALPLDALVMEQLNPFLVLVTGASITASTLYTLQAMTRRRGQTLVALVALASLGFTLAQVVGQGAQGVRTVVFATSLVLMACLPPLLVLRKRLLGTPRSLLLATGYSVALAGAGHDIMMVTGPITPDHWSYLTPGFTVLLLCYTVVVAQYLVRSLNRAERVNEELEHTIQAKTAQLEASYAQLRVTEMANERESARTQEREHLLREMHDGMGAQLMTALRGVERGALSREQVAQSLQDGLDELRLLMDSTDIGTYLPGALATWRNRWDNRLSAAGVQLHWAVDDSLDQVHLPSDTVQQIVRILQEAANNVVKHAGAHNMHLRADVREACLHISLTDDGQGLPLQAVNNPGRGLKNMQYRATHIGAELALQAVASPGQGSCLLLMLPLSPV